MSSILVTCNSYLECKLLLDDLLSLSCIYVYEHSTYMYLVSVDSGKRHSFIISYNTLGYCNLVSCYVPNDGFSSCYHLDSLVNDARTTYMSRFYDVVMPYSFLCFHLCHKSILKHLNSMETINVY